jgi:RNA 2',3'-cyclic 3'-phosphodiesterase
LAERWFFALWPDEAVRAALAARLQALVPSGARATHPNDLHLTLAFLGPLSPEMLTCVALAADRVRAAPFDLDIDQVGYFARARVLWCGPSASPEPLPALVADLQEQLSTCGLAADRRPYRAHVTLARRVAAGSPTPAASAWPTPVRWSARELVLAAGYGGSAPRYRIRRRWTLAATRGPYDVGGFPMR